METNFDKEQLLSIWEEIGSKNFWIRSSFDPAFSKSMLKECENIDELHFYLNQTGSWCLGQGFYFKDLCLINQQEAGDEWLIIKKDKVVNSVSFGVIIQNDQFYNVIEKLLQSGSLTSI